MRHTASLVCFCLILGRFSNAAGPLDVETLLLAYEVKWIQSADLNTNTHRDEAIYNTFGPFAQARPNQAHVLAAIAPLLASSSPGQHAMGLVIALRAESADAMTQVVNEISTLRSNPRFDEIHVCYRSLLPPGGVAGSKSPQWIAPIARLIAMPEIPGMDASLAGALYRIGTPENLAADRSSARQQRSNRAAVNRDAHNVDAGATRHGHGGNAQVLSGHAGIAWFDR